MENLKVPSRTRNLLLQTQISVSLAENKPLKKKNKDKGIDLE